MKYIIDSDVKIKEYDEEKVNRLIEKYQSNIELNEDEIKTLLDYYISLLRENMQEKFNIDIQEDALENRCDYAQKIIFDMMSNNRFIVYPKETQKVINPFVIGHSFLVFNYNNSYYLIDPTFRQFCTSEKCNLDYMIFSNDGSVLRPTDPGYFLNMSNEGKELAKSLIKNGYIKLNTKCAKLYCDSFYNGKTGKDKFSKIDGEIYFSSLIKPEYYCSLSDERYNELYGNSLTK